jgi:hypothetical protein
VTSGHDSCCSQHNNHRQDHHHRWSRPYIWTEGCRSRRCYHVQATLCLFVTFCRAVCVHMESSQ